MKNLNKQTNTEYISRNISLQWLTFDHYAQISAKVEQEFLAVMTWLNVQFKTFRGFYQPDQMFIHESGTNPSAAVLRSSAQCLSCSCNLCGGLLTSLFTNQSGQ